MHLLQKIYLWQSTIFSWGYTHPNGRKILLSAFYHQKRQICIWQIRFKTRAISRTLTGSCFLRQLLCKKSTFLRKTRFSSNAIYSKLLVTKCYKIGIVRSSFLRSTISLLYTKSVNILRFADISQNMSKDVKNRPMRSICHENFQALAEVKFPV